MERYERVRLTNPDKVLYPATGTTKAEIFEYYVAIADVMVPHIAGRPVTRKRWPNGVDEPAFFEKQLASSAPDWLHRGTDHATSRAPRRIRSSTPARGWPGSPSRLRWKCTSRNGVSWEAGDDSEPGPATRIVFDLDPGDGVTMPQLCEVAGAVRELMTDIGLDTYPRDQRQQGHPPVRAAGRSDQLARCVGAGANGSPSNSRSPCRSWSPRP